MKEPEKGVKWTLTPGDPRRAEILVQVVDLVGPTVALDMARSCRFLADDLERRARSLAARNGLGHGPAAEAHGNGQPQAQEPAQRITFSTREVAERLGQPVSYVRALCRQGKIRASRDGKEWLIRPEAIEDWLTQHEQDPARPASPTLARPRPDAAPRLQAVPRRRRKED